jgi:hypothetical protein
MFSVVSLVEKFAPFDPWRQLQMEVEQACDVFKRFNHQLEDGQVLHLVNFK